MQISLIGLSLLGAIVLYAMGGASAHIIETASIQSKQAEVHSVIVDMPQVIDLSGASPDTWASLPPVRKERPLAPDQEAQASDHRPPAS
jgi:hypothetical protein